MLQRLFEEVFLRCVICRVLEELILIKDLKRVDIIGLIISFGFERDRGGCSYLVLHIIDELLVIAESFLDKLYVFGKVGAPLEQAVFSRLFDLGLFDFGLFYFRLFFAHLIINNYNVIKLGDEASKIDGSTRIIGVDE